jgi:hypothetical protein
MTAALRARVLALLREIEWPSHGGDCPYCGGAPLTEAPELGADEVGHEPDCELAALIAELERETEAERQAGMEVRGWDTLAGSGEDEQ